MNLESLQAKLKFRIFLLHVAKELTEKQFGQLKFVLKGFISFGKSEEMKEVSIYFEELERRLFLTPTNLVILKKALEAIGRPDFVEEIEEKEQLFNDLFRPRVKRLEHMVQLEFRTFLLHVANELTEKQFGQLKFVLRGFISSGKCEEMKEVFNYFEELERLLYLTPTKLGILKKALDAIGRPDLVEEIQKKEQRFNDLFGPQVKAGDNLEPKDYDAVCDGIEKEAKNLKSSGRSGQSTPDSPQTGMVTEAQQLQMLQQILALQQSSGGPFRKALIEDECSSPTFSKGTNRPTDVPVGDTEENEPLPKNSKSTQHVPVQGPSCQKSQHPSGGYKAFSSSEDMPGWQGSATPQMGSDLYYHPDWYKEFSSSEDMLGWQGSANPQMDSELYYSSDWYKEFSSSEDMPGWQGSATPQMGPGLHYPSGGYNAFSSSDDIPWWQGWATPQMGPGLHYPSGGYKAFSSSEGMPGWPGSATPQMGPALHYGAQTGMYSEEQILMLLQQLGGIFASAEPSLQPPMSVVPSEINLRGPLALEAYNKALTEGKACVKRVPIMLIGQDRSGKTSLKNSLKRKPFNEDEESTVGIDVDPSHFKVLREIWRPGENDQATNDIETTSFEHLAARLVADELKKEKRDMKYMRSENSEFKKDSSLDVSSSSSNNAAELPLESAPSSETSRDVRESIHTSKDRKDDVRKHFPKISSDSTQRREEHPPLAAKIPDEIAILIKKLAKEVEQVQDEEEIYSILWDFGGQSVYYTTHPLFITTRAMYLLVYDLSRDPYALAEPVVKQGKYQEILENHDAKSNLDYLNFWMTSIASLASQDEDQHVRSGRVQVNTPPVFLVCTHADKPYDGANPLVLARKVLGFLQTKPYRNQLYNDVFVVDNTKSGTESECSEVIRLWEKVLAVAKELPQMKEPIPIKWLKCEKAFQVTAKEGRKWISFEMAKQIASEVCQIDDDKELSTLLDFLHDQRILIHFNNTTVLNNLVVLDPQWLVDVFKKVITVKPYRQQEKEFEELWWRLECEGILEQRLLEHVWGPLFDQQKTSASLIGIMEKFGLLCPWPSSDATCDKQYLVPSMLMSHPPQDIIKLVASAQIPSFFLKFVPGQVPLGLFPRLVLQFFQWGQGKFWSSENPQFYHNFARFYTSGDEDCSVILLCHSLSIEVVVHRGNLSADLEESLQSKLNISANTHYDAFEVACARAVRRQLGLMLECMRKEFSWLKNMTYEVVVMCPICCQGGLLNYRCTHHKQGCRQEGCLHFWTESDLRGPKQFVRCRKCATAQNDKVYVKRSAPWIETSDEQLTIDTADGSLLFPDEGSDEKLLALPSKDLESLLSQPCDSKEVVLQLKQNLQIDQACLEQPDPGTKRLIRCLARKAKQSNRLDVFDHLREITPAGTTGPRLLECLDIRRIPFCQMRALTVKLSGGDEWKIVAEELGLNSDEIRYLDNRTQNPCEALLAYIAQHSYRSVGYLYSVLNKCGFPLVADIL